MKKNSPASEQKQQLRQKGKTPNKPEQFVIFIHHPSR
jgi:hypothetical protein